MNESISQAVKVLKRGGLVGFPTETVYGLGADATNASAVAKLFEVKGRPSTNPLIVHVADEAVARRYALDWPAIASRAAERFWPGPLTLVVRKRPAIVDAVTAGRDTVGLRAPDHPLALELLRGFDRSLAGPSANRSTHVSPTTAQHVRDEFGDTIEIVLDGGPCRIGIESTVLDVTGETPAILRLGAVSRQQLETCLGQGVIVRAKTTPHSLPADSPGQHAVHYAPRTPAFRFQGPLPAKLPRGFGPAALVPLGTTNASSEGIVHIVQMPARPNDYARELYSTLRALDAGELYRQILIELPPDQPQWAAVRDRLLRATQPLDYRT